MPNILQFAVPTRNASLIWAARQEAGINSLLFINQDLNNTVWLGQDSTATANGPNTIPILPNGTFSGDPKSSWYLIGAVAGILPLVMVPNGQGYFLGITAGLGNLVIPKIQSPNYNAGVSGWAIKKDGSAEFNNLTIRGTFAGSNFTINNSGEFFYSGTPALGNLVISIANTGGTDSFTNPYIGGVVLYGPGNSKNVLGWSTFTGSQPLLALFPDASWAYTGNSPFIQSFDTNKGLASEFTALQLGSGNPPAGKGSGIVCWSASPDGTTSIPHVSIFGGAGGTQLADFNGSGLLLSYPGAASTAPKVLMWYVATQSASATTTTALLAILTGPSFTFKSGRAYKISLSTPVVSSVAADTVDMQVREDSSTGTILLETFRIIINAANVKSPAPVYSNYVVNNGADVTHTLIAYIVRGSGTGNVNSAPTGGAVTYMTLEDVGPAGNFVNATSV